MADAVHKIFARNIRAARKAARMSQEQLAFAAGVGRAYVSDVENAKAAVNLDRLADFAEALGTPAHVLLNPGFRPKTERR